MNSIIENICKLNEIAWINPYFLPFKYTKALCELIIPGKAIQDAQERLLRFAPFIKKMFPETYSTDGLIDPSLIEIPMMKADLEKMSNCNIHGKLYLKMDSHIAVAGSVKARGGIYEVLKFAETLAVQNGIIAESDSYDKLASPEAQALFSRYTIQVGSIGNLGMSIGIMSRVLGFNAVIHMSKYSKAVAEGRKISDHNPYSYFIDDEKSVDLFIGYATAASR